MDQIVNILSTLALEFVKLLNEMSPYLLLGFLIAGILHVALPENFIQRFLGKKKFTSVLNASLVGVPLPLCSCGVIPAGISLHKDGASKGSAVSFLTSTPQTGVDSIMVTYSIMGLPFALIRPIVALITGIFAGFLTDKIVKDESQGEQKNQIEDNSEVEKKTFWQNLAEMFHYAFVELLADISKWLLIGLIVATLISVFVPDSFFTHYLSNPFLSMVSILLVSIPLYVCSTGSVPIAAVLLMKGISPGAAFVFLMAGPATNASTITVIGRSLGKKTLTIYLSVIIAGAIIGGLIINHFLPSQWFAISANAHAHSHNFLPLWLTYGSSILLIVFMLYAFVRPHLLKLLKKTQEQDSNGIVVSVKGMDCNHCKASVENGIKRISGIETVQADLLTGQVNLMGNDIDMEQVRKTIIELGYQVE